MSYGEHLIIDPKQATEAGVNPLRNRSTDMNFTVGQHWESDLIGDFCIHRIDGELATIRFDGSGEFCRYSLDFLADAIN